jgi:hypothetical protein
MAKSFQNFRDVMVWTKSRLFDFGYEIQTERWQGKIIKESESHKMIELLNHSFICAISPDITELQSEIKPNLPWADVHFGERVSGIPYNPPPSHEIWPFTQKNNTEFRKESKFSHTYPERIWPKHHIDSEGNIINMEPINGYRFQYGDFSDVVRLLMREPFTRQAVLPIFFPEDTGCVHGERIPCTLFYHFIRRGDFLHVVYSIRSCDFFRHFRDDIYLCCRKLFWVLELLKKLSPEEWANVRPGTLKMDITSLHIFAVERMLLKKAE